MVPSWVVTLESPIVRMRDSNLMIPAQPEYERCSRLLHQTRLMRVALHALDRRHSTINPLICSLSLHITN